MPKKQAKKESTTETLSSVKKEMAKPRKAQSIREDLAKPMYGSPGKQPRIGYQNGKLTCVIGISELSNIDQECMQYFRPANHSNGIKDCESVSVERKRKALRDKNSMLARATGWMR